MFDQGKNNQRPDSKRKSDKKKKNWQEKAATRTQKIRTKVRRCCLFCHSRVYASLQTACFNEAAARLASSPPAWVSAGASASVFRTPDRMQLFSFLFSALALAIIMPLSQVDWQKKKKKHDYVMLFFFLVSPCTSRHFVYPASSALNHSPLGLLYLLCD